jgi:hypothetical protein
VLLHDDIPGRLATLVEDSDVKRRGDGSLDRVEQDCYGRKDQHPQQSASHDLSSSASHQVGGFA